MSTAMNLHHQEQLRALQLANEVRSRRARARRELRKLGENSARAEVGRLLVACPDWLRTVPVHVLICWVPRMGPSRSRQLLASKGSYGVKLVGNLTGQQRRVIARALGYDAEDET